MPHPFHLSCRNGWYYLRFRIPQDLIPVIGRKQVCKSLKTQDKKSAQNLREMYMAQANQIFLLARSNMLNAQAQKAIKHHNENFLQVCELLKCTEEIPFIGMPNQPELILMVNKYQQALAQQNYSLITSEVALLCDEHNLELVPESGRHKMFCRELLKAKIESCQKEMMHLQGIYAQPVQSVPEPSTVSTEKLDKILALVTEKDAPLFSSMIDIFLLDKKEVDRMAERVIKEYRGQLEFIMRVIGDKPMNQYKKKEFVKASAIIRELPSTVNQISALKKMPTEEILAEGPYTNLFAERTVLKFLDKMNSLFKFAAKNDYIGKSLCPSWKASEELEDDEGWAPFSEKDLEVFFQYRYFTKSQLRLKNPENFWTPLIGLFSGLRIGEIAQLYVADIQCIDGAWCFNINRKGDRRLKTANSKRIVPIHDFLQKLGFIKYVQNVSHERLWPSLKWTDKAGYSKDIGNRMQKLIRRHVTVEEDKVFHSFRNTFANFLNQKADVGDEKIAAILGHVDQYKITKLYRGEKPAVFLAKVVNSFDPGIDLSHLL